MFHSHVDRCLLGATVGEPPEGRPVNRVPNAEGGESQSEDNEGGKSLLKVSNEIVLKPPVQAVSCE